MLHRGAPGLLCLGTASPLRASRIADHPEVACQHFDGTCIIWRIPDGQFLLATYSVASIEAIHLQNA